MKAKQLKQLVGAVGGLEQWHHRCHECSLALVRSGLLPESARVARGWCRGIQSQHSWVVIGDPYDPDAPVLDGTFWSYTDGVPRLISWPKGNPRYRPHGAGSIWDYGRPADPTGKVIPLGGDLSPLAAGFLEMMAPNGLDYEGWNVVAHAPVSGWPAREIIEAMYRNKKLRALLPIDVVGMVTDLNPDDLYR